MHVTFATICTTEGSLLGIVIINLDSYLEGETLVSQYLSEEEIQQLLNPQKGLTAQQQLYITSWQTLTASNQPELTTLPLGHFLSAVNNGLTSWWKEETSEGEVTLEGELDEDSVRNLSNHVFKAFLRALPLGKKAAERKKNAKAIENLYLGRVRKGVQLWAQRVMDPVRWEELPTVTSTMSQSKSLYDHVEAYVRAREDKMKSYMGSRGELTEASKLNEFLV